MFLKFVAADEPGGKVMSLIVTSFSKVAGAAAVDPEVADAQPVPLGETPLGAKLVGVVAPLD